MFLQLGARAAGAESCQCAGLSPGLALGPGIEFVLRKHVGIDWLGGLVVAAEEGGWHEGPGSG